ncbi:hypothetical protein [Fusibacter sp. 3D3]|uniref:hypothetical protein n=1 Tax=Fusibacter sp. 3D3 TaxID=1048380 RepID=UPI000852CB3E|nr:hypothetical protein [Fusibacter sp. 3D3]GAU76943.1 hypothetical protein F3D3_1542 [Fusibacter sp. 3D3]
MSERMNELYNLTQKAQKMELINEEIALGIYQEIFANYTPKISKTYESGIRLLEKRHRYDEALVICTRAIELIKADQISGTLERFESIKERLERKMKELNPEPVASEKKPLKINYKFILICFFIFVAGVYLFRLSNPYTEIEVNLEGKQALEGADQVFDTSKSGETNSDEVKYPITEGMIEIASIEGLKNHDVTNISIVPQSETIGIGILVTAGTSEKRCKNIAIDIIKTLSGAASASYSEIKGPGIGSLGEIYDYYELVISVGTGANEDEIIARGTKNKDSADIYWRNSEK